MGKEREGRQQQFDNFFSQVMLFYFVKGKQVINLSSLWIVNAHGCW